MADGHEQENMEGEPTASGSNARTVRQLTGEAAISGNNVRTVGWPTGEITGTQSIQTVTGTVTVRFLHFTNFLTIHQKNLDQTEGQGQRMLEVVRGGSEVLY